MLKKNRRTGEPVRMAGRLIRYRADAADKPRPALFRRSLLSSTSLVALGWLATTVPSRAVDLWLGGANSDWFFVNNWSAGVPTSATDVIIGASSAPYYPVIQAFPPFTAIAQTGSILVLGPGSSSLAPGTLTLQSEANLTNQLDANITAGGKVTVTGERTIWTNNGTIIVGSTGYLNTPSFLNIQGVAQVITKNLELGETGGTGVVTVDGLGSNLTVWDNLKVGAATLGVGTLTIQNGANLRTSGLAGVQIGYRDSFATSTITLKGQSSYWINDNGPIIVGVTGKGTLNIRDATSVVSSAPVIIAGGLGSFGTLNIGAELGQIAAQPGGLMAPIVLFGQGTGEIVFNHTASNYVFAPIISSVSGAGAVLVEAGTTILTAANDYTGPTTVDGGILRVNGSIASSSLTTVKAGGTLGGNGVVGNTLINGGTLAPGTPGTPGTFMTITGNLAFQPGATYAVPLNTTSTTYAVVSGTASLAGTVSASFAPGGYVPKQYDILKSAGLGGTTFGALSTSNLPTNFNASLSYTSTDVLLNLTAALGGSNLNNLNGNQRNVAGGINNFFNNGGTLPPGFSSIFGLTGNALGNALTQLSGEVATGGQQTAVQMTNEFFGLMLDQNNDGRGGAGGGISAFVGEPTLSFPDEVANAYAAVFKAPPAKVPSFERRWSVWASGFGGYNKTNGDATTGTHDTNAHVYGGAAGLDYRVTPDTLIGFALAGAGTNWGLSDGLGGGKSDAFQAGIYGKTHFGPAYVSAALAYANHWISTDRYAMGDHLTAHFDAYSFGGRIEAGYHYGFPVFTVTPYAALQAQSFHTPSYSETDPIAGGFGLTYNSASATDTRSELGARFAKAAVVSNDALLILRARLAWAHDWVTNPSLTAAFQALPGSSFIVNGATPPENSALVTAGLELRLTNGVSLLAKFDGDFASGAQTYAGTGTLRYTW